MIRTGLDRIADGSSGLALSGLRCGLLCHAASVSRRVRPAQEVLVEAGAVIACLFGPEHGVLGGAQYMVSVDEVEDPDLCVPVHSLYGADLDSLSPRPEQLRGLDAVLIDLQDVGSRYYTYVWTAVLMARTAAREGVRCVVLDRPNPLGGQVEGPGVAPGFESFVGLHSVATRHGMTLAEIVSLAVQETDGRCAVEVVELQGWARQMMADETGLPWVLPSPNMPTLDTALVYPGGCLLEGTNVSEGRGTTRPFEICGAPWVDGRELARQLHCLDLPGVRFRPLSFRPTFDKHSGQDCGGVQLHVTDRRVFRPLRTGVALLWVLKQLWPEQFAWREQPYEFVSDKPAIDLLAGGTWLRRGVEQGQALDQLTGGWEAAEAAFRSRRSAHLLYD